MLPSISAYLKKSCTEKSFFLSGCPSADVDDLLISCGTNSMSSISETADSVERSRSTLDNGMLSSRAGNFCTDCGVAVALASVHLLSVLYSTTTTTLLVVDRCWGRGRTHDSCRGKRCPNLRETEVGKEPVEICPLSIDYLPENLKLMELLGGDIKFSAFLLAGILQ